MKKERHDKIYDDLRINNITSLIIKGDLKNAQLELEEYQEEFPHDKEVLYYDALIIEHLALNNPSQSRELFDDALRKFSEVYNSNSVMKYNALTEMGKINRLNNNLKGAIACYKKILSETPYEDAKAVVYLSRCYQQLKDYERAENILLQRINFKDNNYILLELISLYIKTDRLDKAKEYLNYNTSQEKFPKAEKISNRLKGIIARKEKNYEKALTYFHQSVSNKKDITYWKTQYEIVKVYIDQGRFPEALKLCDKIHNSKVIGQNDILFLKAKIYEKNNQKIECLKCYSRILKNKSPKFKQEVREILTSSDLLTMASLAARESRYYDAKQILKMLKGKDLDQIQSRDLQQIQFYLDYKKNKQTRPTNYYESQLTNYNQEKALNHIIDRHYSNKEIEKAKSLMQQIQSAIKNMPTTISNMTDSYVLNIEDSVDKSSHEIKVICLPSTTSIITMYPTDGEDLSNISGELSHPKTMIKSQVDKFNERYKMFNSQNKNNL